MKLGQILLHKKIITMDQLAIGLWIQRVWGGPIGRILQSHGYIEEEHLLGALGDQLELPVVHLKGREIPSSVLSLIPVSVCEQYLAIPFGRVPETGVLQVAMADPRNTMALERCRESLGEDVQIYLAGFIDITECLWYNFKNASKTGGFLISEIRAYEASLEDISEEVSEDEILSELPVGGYAYSVEEDAEEEISDVDDLIEEEYSLEATAAVISAGRSDERKTVDPGEKSAISSRGPSDPSGPDAFAELDLEDFDEIQELTRSPSSGFIPGIPPHDPKKKSTRQEKPENSGD